MRLHDVAWTYEFFEIGAFFLSHFLTPNQTPTDPILYEYEQPLLQLFSIGGRRGGCGGSPGKRKRHRLGLARKRHRDSCDPHDKNLSAKSPGNSGISVHFGSPGPPLFLPQDPALIFNAILTFTTVDKKRGSKEGARRPNANTRLEFQTSRPFRPKSPGPIWTFPHAYHSFLMFSFVIAKK